MKQLDARSAMTIAKGLLSAGFLMAAGFYGCSQLKKDDEPTIEPTTAADECAVNIVEQSILPSIAKLTSEFRTALENGLNIQTDQATKRITAGAEYKINRCKESTGTELTDEIVEEQMRRVESARSQFIEEFIPAPK